MHAPKNVALQGLSSDLHLDCEVVKKQLLLFIMQEAFSAQ